MASNEQPLRNFFNGVDLTGKVDSVYRGGTTVAQTISTLITTNQFTELGANTVHVAAIVCGLLMAYPLLSSSFVQEASEEDSATAEVVELLKATSDEIAKLNPEKDHERIQEKLNAILDCMVNESQFDALWNRIVPILDEIKDLRSHIMPTLDEIKRLSDGQVTRLSLERLSEELRKVSVDIGDFNELLRKC